MKKSGKRLRGNTSVETGKRQKRDAKKVAGDVGMIVPPETFKAIRAEAFREAAEKLTLTCAINAIAKSLSAIEALEASPPLTIAGYNPNAAKPTHAARVSLRREAARRGPQRRRER